jgi:hypothetical protein
VKAAEGGVRDRAGSAGIEPHVSAVEAEPIHRTAHLGKRADTPAEAINLGILAAGQLGDDHSIAKLLDRSTGSIAGGLVAAGVPSHRLRFVTDAPAR